MQHVNLEAGQRYNMEVCSW